MGAGASIPDVMDKDQAQAAAGDFWDEAKFTALAGEGGTVTRDQFAAAAAASGTPLAVGASVNASALASDIRAAIANRKAIAMPMAIRLAWHASGTFDKSDGTGGSDGATMRFEPESTDGANAGLGIMRDMLKPVKASNPDVSVADIWAQAGAWAVEFTGGPRIACSFGRTDQGAEGCPPNGRLPDAALGAQHLRDVFHRQGFNDREIVALSGAHTLGRCHPQRSGFDGPWTSNPLKFDNEYFVNLLEKTWTKREWDGNEQFEDESGELMMLPTDMALLSDEQFRPVVEEYARDEALFFREFAAAFAKLLGNGCPMAAAPTASSERAQATEAFLHNAMHGSFVALKKCRPDADVHAVEASSGRTALHKAAFWGHEEIVKFLLEDCKVDANRVDYNGDTALHDATRFGHAAIVQQLLAAGADKAVANKDGQTALLAAEAFDKPGIAAMLQ
eukprot:g5045.t1